MDTSLKFFCVLIKGRSLLVSFHIFLLVIFIFEHIFQILTAENIKGGVRSFVNKLTRLKNIPDRDRRTNGTTILTGSIFAL